MPLNYDVNLSSHVCIDKFVINAHMNQQLINISKTLINTSCPKLIIENAYEGSENDTNTFISIIHNMPINTLECRIYTTFDLTLLTRIMEGTKHITKLIVSGNLHRFTNTSVQHMFHACSDKLVDLNCAAHWLFAVDNPNDFTWKRLTSLTIDTTDPRVQYNFNCATGFKHFREMTSLQEIHITRACALSPVMWKSFFQKICELPKLKKLQLCATMDMESTTAVFKLLETNKLKIKDLYVVLPKIVRFLPRDIHKGLITNQQLSSIHIEYDHGLADLFLEDLLDTVVFSPHGNHLSLTNIEFKSQHIYRTDPVNGSLDAANQVLARHNSMRRRVLYTMLSTRQINRVGKKSALRKIPIELMRHIASF